MANSYGLKANFTKGKTMLSEKQLLANRQNALRSTGPRTPEGKAVSSQNALRHGLRAESTIVRGEDPEEFDQFRQLLLEDLAPAGALEVMLADRVITGFWKLRRAGGIEAEILDDLTESLFLERKQQSANAADPVFADILPEDFPDTQVLQSYEQAVAAWNRIPDGFAYAEGKMDEESAQDSFLCFIREQQNLQQKSLDTDRVGMLTAIAALRNDCADNSRMFALVTEIERTFQSIAHIPPSRRSIPVTRQFLVALTRHLDRDDEMLVRKLRAAFGELQHIEQSIENRLHPNLGQSLSTDFTGSNVLANFVRYEGHIERTLYKALTELQKFQVVRANAWIPAPDLSANAESEAQC